MKHSVPPASSSMAKKLVNCSRNLSHAGIMGGGVRQLGPNLARFSWYWAVVRPCYREAGFSTQQRGTIKLGLYSMLR